MANWQQTLEKLDSEQPKHDSWLESARPFIEQEYAELGAMRGRFVGRELCPGSELEAEFLEGRLLADRD